MSEDLIQLIIKHARRITKAEQSEANLRMFERLGLDIDDVELMAKAVGLEADDLLLLDTHVSISSKPRRITGRPGRKNTTTDIAEFVAVRKDLMTYNASRVPSMRIAGVREPFCRTCIEAANPQRIANGLDPIVIHAEAYEAEEVA